MKFKHTSIPRLFLSGLLSVFIFAALTSVALAKNGPHLGPGFPQDTDACAGCHRAHTATSEGLLNEGDNVSAFCNTCHNGTGGNTDVLGGDFEGLGIEYGGHNSQTDGEAGKGLNGGGFNMAAVYTGRSGRSSFVAVTSRHNTEATGTAWGGGDIGPGTSINVTCTSCHNAHGQNNPDGTERYRVLKTRVNGLSLANTISSNETVKDYTKDQYKSGTNGTNEFCAACHTQYANSESTYDAGDGKGSVLRERHAVNAAVGSKRAPNLNSHTQLPVEQASYNATTGSSDLISCLTCHQAHGASTTMSGSAQVAPASSSALLRLNNRGVCQDCHQK